MLTVGRGVWTGVSIAFAVFASAHNAFAQTTRAREFPRLELWVAASAVMTGPGGTLVTSYSPPLLFDGDFTSHGGQMLTADAGFATGIAAGINVFPSAHLGFQILIDRAACEVHGANGPYTVALQYVSRQPPDDQTQIVNVQESIGWPDTSGSVTELALGFNGILRIGGPAGLSMNISGGPTFYRATGSLQPVGYTTFHLGGHSVLFEDAYRLAVSLTPAHTFGLNAGVELNQPIGRHAAIVIGYRYFAAPEIDVTAHPAAILNEDQLTFQQSVGDIASRLGAAPMRVALSGSRLVIGVKVLR
jgi:hypothetical protein